MNTDTIKGDAKMLIGKAKEKWAKLGETDYKLFAEGKYDQVSGSIQKAYGKTKEQADKEVADFKTSCGSCSSDKAA